MALTLQQRANIIKSSPLNNAVTFFEKCDASLKNIAGKIIKGTQSIAALPEYVASGVTDAQVMKWCTFILDGDGMSKRMMSSVVSDPGIEPGGIDSTDATIDAATVWCVCRYASLL